jgi:uncharacterized membrane protein
MAVPDRPVDSRAAGARAVDGRAVLLPAAVVGFGLGAFADGIVLHSLLQWHHLVSGRVGLGTPEGMTQNMRADGWFQAACWVVVALGVLWSWRRLLAAPPAPPVPLAALLGAALVGWGAFHVVDQVVFHLLLHAHHIRSGPHAELYDWGYTGLGLLIALAGLPLLRRREHVPVA